MLKLWPLFRFVSRREPTTEAEGSAGLLPATPGGTRGKLLSYIEIETSTNHYKSFTSPNPDINAIVYSSDRVPVGHITYAVSPLFDRLYIFDITIHEDYRRRGFGLTVMSYLATMYRLPITTIKEVSQASGFWHSARLGGAAIDTLSLSEMDTEADRWAHLKPHADKLELLICDRLFRKREAWETAVGRGLPDWPSSTPEVRERASSLELTHSSGGSGADINVGSSGALMNPNSSTTTRHLAASVTAQEKKNS